MSALAIPPSNRTGQDGAASAQALRKQDELERIERENNELLKQLLRRQERAESLRAKVRAVK